MADPAAAFGLFVSALEGCPVARFGTKVLIGAMRVGKTVTYNTKQIIPIPLAEARRYRREYMRAIGNGTLKQHDAKAWLAQQKQIETKSKATKKLAQPGVGAPRVDSDKEGPPNDDPESRSE